VCRVLCLLQSIRAKYLVLVYQDQLSDAAKAAYWQTHGAPENANNRNGGAHFDYLEQYLGRNTGSTAGYVVGSTLTAADLCVWEIVDLHLRIFKEEMEAAVRVV